jgi:ubiquinol-cytochrome c reductase cytochrome b subunit
MAVGVGALTFFGLLLLSASDDVVADWFQVPVNSVVWTYRILVLVLPPVAAVLSFLLARALRSVAGGFADLTRPDLRAALRRRSKSTTQRQHSPNSKIEVSSSDDKRWQWQYVEIDGSAKRYTLASTNDYASEEAAWSAAGQAYPAVRGRAGIATSAEVLTKERAAERTITIAAAVVVLLSWIVSVVRNRH